MGYWCSGIRDRDDNLFEKIERIRLLQNWPTHEEIYVPAEISYTPSPKGCRQWGFDIDDGSKIHKWLRLDLEEGPRDQELKNLADLVHQATVSDLVDSVPPWLYKSPEQVARDYLRYIAEHVLDELIENVGRFAIADGIPIHLVVSYPSVSSMVSGLGFALAPKTK